MTAESDNPRGILTAAEDGSGAQQGREHPMSEPSPSHLSRKLPVLDRKRKHDSLEGR